MARQCKCCTRDIVGSKCGYCKYINIEVLDNFGSEVEFERAEKYKEDLLSCISDFSINGYTYKWNSESLKLDYDRSKLIIASSVKHFDEIVWSQVSFGQSSDEKQTEHPIIISYKVNGEKKELNVKLKPVKCNDFWKLGVIINNDLTVNFYLGTIDNYTISGPFDLELE